VRPHRAGRERVSDVQHHHHRSREATDRRRPDRRGALALLVFPYAMISISLGVKFNGDPTGLATHGWQTVVFHVMYWPLAVWSPLLALLTVHYCRRRTVAPRHRAMVPSP
jgi:hypothetical protein